MSYAPGAPAQIWAIPNDELPAGVKLTLMYLWSKADHDTQRDPEPCAVWVPKRHHPDGSRMKPVETLLADIADATGAKPATVKKHLTRLNKSGLAIHDGRMVDLLPPWSCGYGPLPQGDDQHHDGAPEPGPDRSVTETGVTPTEPSRSVTAPSVAPHTVPPVPSSPPSPGEDARPSGKPANGELPNHAAKALAKATRTPVPATGSKLSPELCRAIGATSQAAALALANSNSHQWAWAPMLHERMLSEAWTDAEPIAVLAVWESTARADKPAMGELWQRKHAGWCREALGDDAGPSSSRVQSAPPSSGYDFTSDDIKADLEAGRI